MTGYRGEVWEVNLDPTIGAEIKKSRPCVIVSDDGIGVLPLKIIVPITDWNGRFQKLPWHVHLSPTPQNGLAKESSADTFQVRSVSETRLIQKYGALPDRIMEEIAKGLKISLGMED